MVVHAWILGKFILVCVLVFAVLIGVIGGAYLCFTINPVLGATVVAALAAGVYLIIRHLSRTGVLRRLQLLKGRAGVGEGTPEADELKALVGTTATAETPLRPSGAIRTGGKRVVATTEASFIEKGATVKIIKAGGANVVVREVLQDSDEAV